MTAALIRSLPLLAAVFWVGVASAQEPETREYPAVLRHEPDVYDGDTVRLDVDLGFGAWKHKESFRLFGIDTPELRGGTAESKAAAQAARKRLLELIHEHDWDAGPEVRIWIRTHKDEQDKYGRYLVELLAKDRRDTLNAILLREGHAVEYQP